VTVIGTQVNPESGWVVVVIVTVSVTKSGTAPAQAEACRLNTGGADAASAIEGGPRRLAMPVFKDIEYDPPAGLEDGGLYESPQSVPSWIAAPAEFVTVSAGQLKSVASLGSSSSVIVVVIVSLGGQEVRSCVGDAGAKYCQ
jgi:hypothetical protein